MNVMCFSGCWTLAATSSIASIILRFRWNNVWSNVHFGWLQCRQLDPFCLCLVYVARCIVPFLYRTALLCQRWITWTSHLMEKIIVVLCTHLIKLVLTHADCFLWIVTFAEINPQFYNFEGSHLTRSDKSHQKLLCVFLYAFFFLKAQYNPRQNHRCSKLRKLATWKHMPTTMHPINNILFSDETTRQSKQSEKVMWSEVMQLFRLLPMWGEFLLPDDS